MDDNGTKKCMHSGCDNLRDGKSWSCKLHKIESVRRSRAKKKRLAGQADDKNGFMICCECKETRYPFTYLKRDEGYCCRCFDKMSEKIVKTRNALKPTDDTSDFPF